VCTQWAETGRLAETWQTMNVGLADAGCWLLVAGCCYCSPAQVHFTSESSVTGFPEAVRDSSAPSGKTWPTKNEDRDSTELPTPPPDLPTHPTHTHTHTHTHTYAPAHTNTPVDNGGYTKESPTNEQLYFHGSTGAPLSCQSPSKRSAKPILLYLVRSCLTMNMQTSDLISLA
jgi:hypothetical protein